MEIPIKSSLFNIANRQKKNIHQPSPRLNVSILHLETRGICPDKLTNFDEKCWQLQVPQVEII